MLPHSSYTMAEILMGRKVKTDIPQTSSHLTSQWDFLPDFQQKDKEFKEKQKRNYDHQHHVRPTDTLVDDGVITNYNKKSGIQYPNQTPGRVVSNAGTPDLTL